jgi:hypothetical protein
LSLAEYRGTDKLIVPIYNPQPVDEQVQEIGIDLQWLACPAVSSPPPSATYAIDGSLKVLAGGVVVGVVTPESGPGTGASVRAIGSVKTAGGCIAEVTLNFRPPALLLGGKTTTPISVVMPVNNTFTISKAAPDIAENKDVPAFANVPAGDFQIPDFTGAPWMAEITVRDNFGVQSSSCEISSATTC